MKRNVLYFMLSCLAFAIGARAEDSSIYNLVAGQDYYIYNTYYDRVLGPSADNAQPRLTVYNAERDAQYLFTAVSAPTAGYFMLRHKATGRYMTASTSNSYSVLLTASSGTGNAYQWRVRPGEDGALVSLRNTSTTLGVDTAETAEYIGVWYDKVQGAETTRFQVFEANGEGMTASRKAWAMKELGNVADYIEQELENKGYPLLYRTRLPQSIGVAREWIAHPETKETEQFLSKAATLRDSLALMTSYESTVLLTETEMSSFGSSFSLAISDFALNSVYAGDSVYVLVRNKEGRGARFVLRDDGNYIFVYHDAQMQLYKDGRLVQTTTASFIPKITAQGTEAEWTIIRKSRVGSALPELLSETAVVTEGGGVTKDKYGNNYRAERWLFFDKDGKAIHKSFELPLP